MKLTQKHTKIDINYCSYRCVICGSEEGQPHLHWPETKIKLQESHKKPEEPLGKESFL